MLPPALTRRAATTSAKRLGEVVDDGTLVATVTDELARLGPAVDERVVHDVLAGVAASFHDVALVATREAERRAELAELAPQVLDVPTLDSDIHDVGGLLTIAGHLRD